MHYTGQVYRPPTEASTPLLEVTAGCSYNRCAYCTMYDRTAFSISPEENIISDLEELSVFKDRIGRIYLLNGDPFILPADKLLRIADLIHEYLPNVITITCYASIRDIMNKTPEEMRKLREAGYNEVYIGIETAYQPALEMINKGCSNEDEYRELGKLKAAGMDYIAIIMNGIAGKGKSKEHVEATVKLLNETQPVGVGPMSTSVSPGSELEAMRDRGEYTELTEGEILEEEIALLEGLELDPEAFWFGSHVFNNVSVSGLFKKKEEMLARLRAGLDAMSEEERKSIRDRGHI